MTRIAFIGAGSIEFTRDLLGDLLTFPELAVADDRAARHRPGAAGDRGGDGALDRERLGAAADLLAPTSTAGPRSTGRTSRST